MLFTVLSRDARATQLVVRFNAIDSDFKTMRVVGVQASLSGSMDILESTKAILEDSPPKTAWGRKEPNSSQGYTRISRTVFC